jgi:hypothetical protein
MAFVSFIAFCPSVTVLPNTLSSVPAIWRVGRRPIQELLPYRANPRCPLEQERFNYHRDALVFARYHVKMRRRVIIKVHLNSTPIEPDDSWHIHYTSA